MKWTQKLLDEAFARRAAGLMCWLCRLVMAFALFCLVLSVLGRQTFTLHTAAGTFERAIMAEQDHAAYSGALTVHTSDDVYVHAADGQPGPAVRVGLVLLYAADALPMLAAYWLLSRVFGRVAGGQIFTAANARSLLYYGLLQLAVALLIPWVKMAVCALASLAGQGELSLSTGSQMLNAFIPSIAFLVAAYILHYGIHLQDEVDHTL